MKQCFLIYFLCLLLISPGLAISDGSPAGTLTAPEVGQVSTDSLSGQKMGLFVTVIQEPPVLSSREAILELIDFAKKYDIEMLFVQIYRANKAWFPSKVADSEPYKSCLKSVKEDPFQLLIKEAHAAGIEVHAWLNMLTLSQNVKAKILKKYGKEILTRNMEEKKKIEDYRIDNQYFLEPGDLRVREYLSKLVEEILRAYPELDGILFDYIRYPDRNPAYGYTKMNMERFKKATGLKTIEEGSKIWNDWKRSQVTEMLEGFVKRTRLIRPDIQVSATGCSSFGRAYDEAFQNWPSWIDRQIVDFVTFMSYSADPAEYEKVIREAKTKTKDVKKMDIAVGAYKSVNSPETFMELFNICQKADSGACIVFHYGSFLENPALAMPISSRVNKTKDSRS